jgi:hypothetical protein
MSIMAVMADFLPRSTISLVPRRRAATYNDFLPLPLDHTALSFSPNTPVTGIKDCDSTERRAAFYSGMDHATELRKI